MLDILEILGLGRRRGERGSGPDDLVARSLIQLKEAGVCPDSAFAESPNFQTLESVHGVAAQLAIRRLRD